MVNLCRGLSRTRARAATAEVMPQQERVQPFTVQDANTNFSICILKQLALGFVYWGLLVKCSEQQLRRWRSRYRSFEHDVLGAHFFPV
jgi:hypothetical protein